MMGAISKKTLGLLLGLTVLMGLSFFSRHLFGLVISGGNYNPLVFNTASIQVIPPARYDFKPDDAVWDEMREYARFTQEILRGEWLGAAPDTFDAYLKEGTLQGEGWYRDRLGPALLALFAAPFGGDVQTAFLIADLVFPLLLAFFLLVLAWQFYPNLKFAVLATSLILWFDWQDLLALVSFLRGAPQNAAIWLRTPYPQFSALLLVLFFIALLYFHRQPTVRAGVYVGLILLVTFYTYFYAWSFAFVMTGLYLAGLVLYFTAKRFLQVEEPWGQLKILLPVLAGVTVLAYPAWGDLIKSSAAFRDSFVRVFGEFSHSPDWGRSVLLGAMLGVTLLIKQSYWQTRWFWVLYWATSLVLLNQQILTGKVNQPGHWTGNIIEPFALLYVCDIGVAVYRRWQKNARHWQWNPMLVTAMVVIVFVAGMAQNVYKFWRGAEQAAPYNLNYASLRELIGFMERPEVRNNGFLTNDPYLDIVLPGYLPQKPLNPWYMDPLTDAQIQTLRDARTLQFGEVIGAAAQGDAEPETNVRFDASRVLLVINRSRETAALSPACQVLYENPDLVVLRAEECAP